MRPKMAPKCLPEGPQIAPKSPQNGSRRPPGAPPRAETKVVTLFDPFLSPLGRLLGRSWGAPGGSWGRLGASWAAPGPSRGAPGGHVGLPGSSFEFFGSLFGAFEKNTKKQRFAAFLGSCFWLVLCGVFFALLAMAVRERALKNMKIIWFLQCMAPVGRLRAERKQRGTMKKNEEQTSQKTHRKTRAETALKNSKK